MTARADTTGGRALAELVSIENGHEMSAWAKDKVRGQWVSACLDCKARVAVPIGVKDALPEGSSMEDLCAAIL